MNAEKTHWTPVLNQPFEVKKCQLGLNVLNVIMFSIKWATSWENLFMPYVNNNDSAHTHYASTQSGQQCFVHCFDSRIPIVAKPKVSSLSLVSVAEQIGLNLTWLHTPEDRFSRDEAQIKLILNVSRILGV